MCFSATASFIAGGTLTVLGSVMLRRIDTKSERPFAAIPLLFGIQQIVEGMLWLAIQHDMALIEKITTYLFTIFSHLLWPTYIPYAIALMEKETETWRNKLMWTFRTIGLIVTVHLLVQVTMQPLMAVVDRHMLYISPFFYEWPMMVLYVASTCIVALFSSHILIRILGLMILISFLVSYLFYMQALFSVWCFFAALLSLIIYIHFKNSESWNH